MRLRATFAANLRKARQTAGVSQEELATLAGIDRTYVSSLERSVYAASVDVIERIADALKIDPSELLVPQRRSRTE